MYKYTEMWNVLFLHYVIGVICILYNIMRLTQCQSMLRETKNIVLQAIKARTLLLMKLVHNFYCV